MLLKALFDFLCPALTGRFTLYFGGGGGGGGENYYENQDKLFGVQADIAQSMYNEYAGRAPKYLNNSSAMVDEAMSGALATRARGQAGADASMALGQGLQSAMRSTARYGAEFNPDRMASRAQEAAINGAAMKSGAMNQAGQWAEDQKWNRNAGAFGQLAGMGTGAMEGLGSAARGYGSMAMQQEQSDSANAAGYGRMGATIGSALFKADGGYIRDPRDGGVRLAAGGLAPLQDWRTRPTMGGAKRGGADGFGQMVSGMAPSALQYGLKQSGIGESIKGGLKNAFSGAKDAMFGAGDAAGYAQELGYIPDMMSPAAGAADAGALTAGSSELAAGAAGAAETGALTAGATELAAVPAASSAGAGAAAAGGAAAGTGAAATGAAAMGPVGWAALAAAALSQMEFADGGKVHGRKPYQKGGEVDGPGSETSDSIPAWLSDGEYVLNAEAVDMVGLEALEKINRAGLQKRGGAPRAARLKDGGLADRKYVTIGIRGAKDDTPQSYARGGLVKRKGC